MKLRPGSYLDKYGHIWKIYSIKEPTTDLIYESKITRKHFVGRSKSVCGWNDWYSNGEYELDEHSYWDLIKRVRPIGLLTLRRANET